jgi:hypothetical protein
MNGKCGLCLSALANNVAGWMINDPRLSLLTTAESGFGGGVPY